MLIMLPLAILGFGFLLWLPFAAAAQALPLLAGLSAAFAANHAGASGATSLLLGIVVFMGVIALGRALTTLLSARPARAPIILLFALPATAATASVTTALGRVTGIDSWAVVILSIAAAFMGGAAGRRTIDPPPA